MDFRINYIEPKFAQSTQSVPHQIPVPTVPGPLSVCPTDDQDAKVPHLPDQNIIDLTYDPDESLNPLFAGREGVQKSGEALQEAVERRSWHQVAHLLWKTDQLEAAAVIERFTLVDRIELEKQALPLSVKFVLSPPEQYPVSLQGQESEIMRYLNQLLLGEGDDEAASLMEKVEVRLASLGMKT